MSLTSSALISPTYQTGITQMRAARNLALLRIAILEPYELSVIEWFLMGTAYDMQDKGGICVTDLAALFGVKTTYVTATLNTLKAKGYVATKQDRHDARVRLVHVTPKGKKATVDIEDAMQHMLRDTLGDTVSDTQYRGYVHVLDKISSLRPAAG